ncbi:hypothetical protein D3C87_2017680 [compost metagenome]
MPVPGLSMSFLQELAANKSSTAKKRLKYICLIALHLTCPTFLFIRPLNIPGSVLKNYLHLIR